MKTDTSHYYTKSGLPAHWIPKKDGSGNRPTTIADCKKLDLIPSPTTVLKLLNKPALIDWMIRQAVHAVATAPDISGEGLDAKINRVLEEERQQDEEAQIARDLGTSIHEAIEFAVTNKPWDKSLKVFVDPVMGELARIGRVVASEQILVGSGYAGKADCIIEGKELLTVGDFKTSKKIPDRSPWPEHLIQCGAYCGALPSQTRISAVVIYISTTEPGLVKCFHVSPSEWPRHYQMFRLLLDYWRMANGLDLIDPPLPL